ncbi:MAG: ATP-binding cassette domain-containing protein [Dactylosporangium sp.]|nr:ATP-binding cassette domain-containing protein [Dactylosporangium sp.]
MTATLVVDNLHKTYAKSDKPALNGLSFTARQGEILALLGPNGAGKSTALRCVAGMLLPDSGQVRLHGPDSSVHTDHRGISFFPETPDLYGGLTVNEHLRFVALAYRLRDWQAHARALLDRAGAEYHVRAGHGGAGPRVESLRSSAARWSVESPTITGPRTDHRPSGIRTAAHPSS